MTSTTMASEDLAREALEPCKFCGGNAQVIEDEQTFCVLCTAADCYAAVGENYDRSAMPDHVYASEDAAIAAWNRRARTAYDAIGSGVKALEWDGDHADTSIGRYAIRRTPDGYGVLVDGEEIAHLGYDAPRAQPSACDAARDYAQADFERRVLSCLSTHTAMDGLAERFTHLSETLRSIETLPKVGDLYYAVKNDGEGTGWRYVASGVIASDIHDAASALSTHTAAGAGPVGEAVAPKRRMARCIVCGDYSITPGCACDPVRRADARPVEEPGEVERLTRERDEALTEVRWLNINLTAQREAQSELTKLWLAACAQATAAEAALADREARPSPSREEQIREDERDRLYEKADQHHRQHARQFLGDNGAMLPADRARLRGGTS